MGWMSAVSAAAQSRAWARKREGAWKMESGGEGWLVLCAGKEKREWLLWCVYMSVHPPLSLIKRVCVSFHTEILVILLP